CLFLSYFFSSRRRHTRFSRDWSSDVCSSDLLRSGDDVPAFTHLADAITSPGAVSGIQVISHWQTDFLYRMSELTRDEVESVVSQIGRASCRERVYISVCAVSLAQKRQPAAKT